jgi:hypothetical protein
VVVEPVEPVGRVGGWVTHLAGPAASSAVCSQVAGSGESSDFFLAYKTSASVRLRRVCLSASSVFVVRSIDPPNAVRPRAKQRGGTQNEEEEETEETEKTVCRGIQPGLPFFLLSRFLFFSFVFLPFPLRVGVFHDTFQNTHTHKRKRAKRRLDLHLFYLKINDNYTFLLFLLSPSLSHPPPTSALQSFLPTTHQHPPPSPLKPHPTRRVTSPLPLPPFAQTNSPLPTPPTPTPQSPTPKHSIPVIRVVPYVVRLEPHLLHVGNLQVLLQQQFRPRLRPDQVADVAVVEEAPHA